MEPVAAGTIIDRKPHTITETMRNSSFVRRHWSMWAALLAVAGVAAQPRVHTAQEPGTVDDVIARAASYVEAYVEGLSTVVMEEDYRQTFFEPGVRSPARTQLVSEFLLVRIPGADRWVGFRDVFRVNGRQVRDREDRLAALFLADSASGALAQARRISQESSRYNLGTTERTFNIPTFALFYLHPDNLGRFRFSKNGEGCGGEDTAWDIGFEETQRPTLTRGYQGIDLLSRGRFCLDPASGRVIETELKLHHPAVGNERAATDATARVRFELEPTLTLWVPVEMRESYREQGGGSANSTARYRNYRQFGVTVTENTDTGSTDPPQ